MAARRKPKAWYLDQHEGVCLAPDMGETSRAGVRVCSAEGWKDVEKERQQVQRYLKLRKEVEVPVGFLLMHPDEATIPGTMWLDYWGQWRATVQATGLRSGVWTLYVKPRRRAAAKRRV